MIIPTASTDCLRAAPQHGPRLSALAISRVLFAFGLLALMIAAFAPARSDLATGGPSFRPVLSVMALHSPPSHAPLVQRLDRDGSAITAAEIDLPADPALPSPPVEFVPTQNAVATSFRLTSTALPAPAPLASPLRPPRLA